MKKIVSSFAILFIAMLVFASVFTHRRKAEEPAAISIVGYVRDAACVYRFHEVLKPCPTAASRHVCGEDLRL